MRVFIKAKRKIFYDNLRTTVSYHKKRFMNSRRHFLKNITAAAIAVPFSSEFISATTSCNSYDGPLLRVAIMGLGSYGTRVAEAMRDCKAAKLVGAISGHPDKITNWQSKYGIAAKNCYNYENFDSINSEISNKYMPIISKKIKYRPYHS